MADASRPTGETLSDAFASWVDTSASFLVSACAKVDAVLLRLSAPVVEELRGLVQDMKSVMKAPAADQEPQTVRSLLERIDLRAAKEIFVGTERETQLELLESDGESSSNPEEALATKRLIAGTATASVNILGMLYHPGFFLLGIAGLAYHSVHVFRRAYQAIVHERTIDIFVVNALSVTGALLSGSIVAATVGIFTGALLEWIVTKTESLAQRSVSSAFAKQPRSVWVRIDGVDVEVAFDQVGVGDIVVVNAGSMIPVDGLVIDGMASVDQRMLTGESQGVDKGPGERVMASTFVLSGRLYIQVERSGGDTVAAQIAQVLVNTKQYKKELRSRAEEQLEHLAPPYMTLAALTIPIWGLNSGSAVLRSIPAYRMMFFGPLTMLSFMHVAARMGLLLKNSRALEKLGSVDTVIFDKTGTLTLDQPQGGRIFCFSDLPESEVLRLAAAAESAQTHPIALAILALARQRTTSLPTVDEPEVSIGFGVSVRVAGQRIIVGSERLMSTIGVPLGATAEARQRECHEMGHSLIFIARESELVGAIEICPTIRPEATRLVSELRRLGKKVMVVSGDHEAPTRSLSMQLGVDRYFAQVLPDGKSKIIDELRAEGRVVCFVGDGINDSLALQRADVSISMMGASSIATTVAQIVIMRQSLDSMLTLFDMADRFEHYMRVNRIAAAIPGYLILGGTLAFGWGFAAAVLLNQLSSPIALYSLLGPVNDYQSSIAALKAHATTETTKLIEPGQNAPTSAPPANSP